MLIELSFLLLLLSLCIAGISMRLPKKAAIVVLLAFFFRVSFVLLDSQLQIFVGGGDFPLYDKALWYVATQWREGQIFAPLALLNRTGYFTVLYTTIYAPVYVVFGHNPTLVRLLVATTGTLFVINVYRLTAYLSDRRAGLYAAGLISVYPMWIQLSGSLYRDTLLVLLLSEALLHLVISVQKTKSIRNFSLSLFFFGAALTLRLENVIPIAAVVGTGIYIQMREPVYRYISTISAGTIGGLVTIYVFGIHDIVDRLSRTHAWLSRSSNAAYLSHLNYTNVYEMFAYLPIGTIYFVLVPFPWQVVNLLAVVAILQNMFLWYPALMIAVFGIRDLLSDSPGQVIILVVYFAIGISLYGLVEGNIGPAMRHRAQFQFVVIIFAAVALSRRIRFEVSSHSKADISLNLEPRK